MSIFFLDPLVLAAYAVLGVGVWSVWTGGLRWWFGHDAGWTLAAWPLPLVTGALPVLAALVAAAFGWIGIDGEEGGAMAGAVYLGAYTVPWLWLSLSPPRWLLPPWARARLTRLPDRAEAPVPAALPALHAWRGRGHAARSRWVWAVDAVPGFLWVEDGVVRFRATDEAMDAPGGSALLDAIDDDLLSRVQLHMGDELRLEPPAGGWWTRRSLDVELEALESWTFSAGRPGARAGLLTLVVAGRRPVRFWVPDTAPVRSAISGASGATTPG